VLADYSANANLAGGQAVDSNMKRLMDLVPEVSLPPSASSGSVLILQQHIHDRSGVFLGSYDEVQKVIDVHKKHGINA
jgi:fructose-1,6-bisphosphatase I